MASFDPKTAHANEWEFIDGVEDCTFHRRNPNGDVSEEMPAKLLVMSEGRAGYQAYGQGVQGAIDSPDAFLWLLPLPLDAGYPDPPQIGDAITRLSESTVLGISEVDDPRRQPYSLKLAEVRSNE